MARIFSILLMVIVIGGGFILVNTAFIVHETQQALVVRFGELQPGTKEPGLHFKAPFIDQAIVIDRRILDLDTDPEEVLTSDQKRLIVDAFARFKIDNAQLYYEKARTEFEARQSLSRFFNTALREVLAGQEFAALLTGARSALMEEIRTVTNNRAKEIGLQVIDVRIRTADLPDENSQAVFRRMRAEREREAREARAQGQELSQRIRSRAEREAAVLLADANRDSEIIRGEGDAERNKTFAEAFNRDPDFFAFYRAMQAYGKALSGSDTTMVLSPDSEFFRYFGSISGENGVPADQRR